MEKTWNQKLRDAFLDGGANEPSRLTLEIELVNEIRWLRTKIDEHQREG